MKTKYKCIVCGWHGLETKPAHPYHSYEICACCGTEFGVDVQEEKDILAIKKCWLDEGALWFDDEDDIQPPKPEDWCIDSAIKQINKIKCGTSLD